MELKLGDSVTLAGNLANIDSIIKNLDNYKDLIPNIHDFARSSKDSFSAKINVPLGSFAADFDVIGKLKEKNKGRFELSVSGHTIGSEMKMSMNINTASSGKNTKLTWDTSITLTGLASALGSSLLKGIITEKTAEIIENVQKLAKSGSKASGKKPGR